MALVKTECLSPRDTMKQAVEPPNIKKQHNAAKKRRWNEVDIDVLLLNIF